MAVPRKVLSVTCVLLAMVMDVPLTIPMVLPLLLEREVLTTVISQAKVPLLPLMASANLLKLKPRSSCVKKPIQDKLFIGHSRIPLQQIHPFMTTPVASPMLLVLRLVNLP